MRTQKNLLLALGLVIIVGLGAWVGIANSQKSASSATPTPTATISPTPLPTDYSFQGTEGKTALDGLKEKQTVEVKSYSFGDLVTGINGLNADDTHYWAFKVNGQDAAVGAGAYTMKAGDTIQFVYTAM